ncbi:VTT domain-containing protein [Chamaesiphon sp. VAR_48_metabat_403]|uniref:DedA family protein n=1 Tax=Chamaesiphon sp. VAR_48_metabat_403 TaxID=2964700 RepID=UPI00286E0D9F|nr:VTT domain-containing protein [Chamaesiphon sp. VAR_48_metabat_403]
MHFDLPTLIKTFGYPLVWGIVFAESGLLVGFLLPGDSLLFVAGFLCSLPQTGLDISVMAFGCFVFAVLGDSVGYYTGKRFGRKLFDKEDSKFFNKKHLIAAEDFFESQGKTALILARFMPFVRTFAPIVAGIAAMQYRTFMTYNVVGGFGWGIGLTVLGYFLGKIIPAEQLDRYLIPIVLLVMFISLAPSVIHMLKARQRNKN